MESNRNNLLKSLGFLRLSLLALALINLLLPAINLLGGTTAVDYHDAWKLLSTVIAPVMAPLLTVVLLFDYIMSRVRAADAEGEERALYTRIGRLERIVIVITLLFWVPYFVSLLT